MLSIFSALFSLSQLWRGIGDRRRELGGCMLLLKQKGRLGPLKCLGPDEKRTSSNAGVNLSWGLP